MAPQERHPPALLLEASCSPAFANRHDLKGTGGIGSSMYRVDTKACIPNAAY